MNRILMFPFLHRNILETYKTYIQDLIFLLYYLLPRAKLKADAEYMLIVPSSIFVSGFSDPYCMGGIVPGRRLNENESDQGVFSDEDEHLERRKSGRKFSLTGKKKDKSARNMVPARLIRTTHVVPNTVNPEWNEKFRL